MVDQKLSEIPELTDAISLAAWIEISQSSNSVMTSFKTTVGALLSGVTALLGGKQDTLVSATNIKTINGASVLGAGDLTVGGASSVSVGSVILNLPMGRGVTFHSQLVNIAGVAANDIVMASLGNHLDSDTNCAEMLDVQSIAAISQNGAVRFDVAFNEPTSGNVKLQYMKA